MFCRFGRNTARWCPGIVHDQSSTGATVFIEPMSVVEIGNELKQLISAEKVEIEKILRTLSAQIAPEADAISDNLAILAQLDFAFAKASLAKQMNGCMPKINREGRLNIVRGRHPLIDPPEGRTAGYPAGQRLYDADHHRPEHGRQNGDAKDHGSVYADGAAPACRSRRNTARSWLFLMMSSRTSATSNPSNSRFPPFRVT